MKRRTFLSTLAAASAAPLMPAASLAAPGTGAAQHFALAKLLTRAQNHCSPQMLAQHLRISPDMARQVQRLLLERGVITPPVAGVSVATNPMNTNCVPREALKPANLAQNVADVRTRVQDLMERHKARLMQTEAPETDIQPQPEPDEVSQPLEAQAETETADQHTKS